MEVDSVEKRRGEEMGKGEEGEKRLGRGGLFTHCMYGVKLGLENKRKWWGGGKIREEGEGRE